MHNSLTHFCQSITMANASWTPGSELEGVLETFSGDIVQSMQALKESGLPADDHLKQQLQALAKTLVDCKRHCLDKNPEPLTFPLRRALRQVYDAYSFFFPSASALDAVDDADARIEINPTSSSHVETVKLGQLQFPRLLNGFWQLSSPAWGSASAESQDEALKALIEAGLTAADMADHYVRFLPRLRSPHMHFPLTTNTGRCGAGVRELPEQASSRDPRKGVRRYEMVRLQAGHCAHHRVLGAAECRGPFSQAGWARRPAPVPLVQCTNFPPTVLVLPFSRFLREKLYPSADLISPSSTRRMDGCSFLSLLSASQRVDRTW